MSGIIYLVQPAELIGTKRYKIGCSKKTTLDRVKNGYKKGTRYLHIAECNEPHKTEGKIKEIFNNKFTLIAGNEYYEGDELIMKQEFINVLSIQNSNTKLNKENKEIIIHNNLDQYIRSKLGNQRIDFSVNDLRYIDYDDNYYENIHNKQRISGKKISEIFMNDFNPYKIVIYPYKGCASCYIISNDDYNKYNYWDIKKYGEGINDSLSLPYKYGRTYSWSTVEIIKDLINKSKKIHQMENDMLYVYNHENEMKDLDYIQFNPSDSTHCCSKEKAILFNLLIKKDKYEFISYINSTDSLVNYYDTSKKMQIPNDKLIDESINRNLLKNINYIIIEKGDMIITIDNIEPKYVMENTNISILNQIWNELNTGMEFIVQNNKMKKYEHDDNFEFEDLPMPFQVLLERTFTDEKGTIFYDNCSLFWTKINNINSLQIDGYKKTNAKMKNFDELDIHETVINFTDNFNDNEINIIKKYNLHTVESIIRNNDIDNNEKKRTLLCYKFVKERYDMDGFEPPNGHTYLTLNNILLVILINHKGGITFIKKLPGKKEDYTIFSMKEI